MGTINENAYYKIGQAANLVGVDRHTLLRHAQDRLIPYTLNACGLKKFYGKDLIHYMNFTI